MNAIRARRAAPCATELPARPVKAPPPAPQNAAAPAAMPAGSPDAAARFKESMVMNYERWHDGTGYDIGALSACTPADRAELERVLTAQPAQGWRDIEALAALGTPAAHDRLREALHSGSHELAMAVLRHAPEIPTATERSGALVAALHSAGIYDGLTRALDLVERIHPPDVMAALWRGALERDGETAVHCAAMLMFLHGKAESAFDWKLRPFFLRFHTSDRAERAEVFRELCRQTGARPEPYLDG
jgi:hypothetical protein